MKTHRQCDGCRGQDHHWLDGIDEEAEAIQVCKHCDATRPYPHDWEAEVEP